MLASLLVLQLAASASAPGAGATYEDLFIGAEHHSVVTTDADGNARSSVQTFFYRGRYQEPLSGPDLYEAIGRADLAEVYRSRMTTKRTLYWIGGGVAVAGLVYAIANFDSGPSDPRAAQFANQAAAASSRTQSGLLVGALISAAGLVTAGIGWAIDPDPIDETEQRRLVDDYDRGLAARLGIGRASGGDPGHLSLGLAPRQGGCMATVTFAL